MQQNNSRETILILADGQSRNRDIIRRALRELKYHDSRSLKDSKEALDLVKSGVGDIVVADAQNAQLSGMDLLKSIRGDKDLAHIPVILTSFLKTSEDIIKARKEGADGYVVKPLTSMALINQVKGAAKFRTDKVSDYYRKTEGEIEKHHLDLVTEQKEKKNLYIEVIKRLNLLQVAFPFYEPIFLQLGEMFINLGTSGKAAPYLRKALDLNQNSTRALDLLSDHYAANGEHDKAIKHAKQSASVSGLVAAYEKLGEIQLKAGRLNDSIVTFNSVITMTEAQTRAADQKAQLMSRGLNLRGQAYRAKGDKEGNKNLMGRAVQDFKKSSELDPDFLAANYNLMVTYKKMGEKQKAMQVFDRIRKMEPKDADSWISLAEAYFQNNDIKKVSFALERALKLEWSNLKYRKLVAELFLQYGLIDKAEAILKIIQKETPDESYCHNILGIICRKRGQPEKAVEHYRRAIKLEPDDPGILFNLSRALKASGNEAEARKAYDKCLALDPEFDQEF